MKKLGLFWALAFVVLAWPVFGVGFIVVDEAHWWPGPTPPYPIPPYPPPHPVPPWPPEIIVARPRPHVFAPLEVQEVKARTHIKDQVATTTVLQEFYNPNTSQLEGTFMFPVPKGAHVGKFSMDIDGKQVAAELLTASKARSIYEEIVRKAKDPALMEYAGQDMFKVRIFPIEPHSKKKIKVSYTELLKSDGGFVAYTLPLRAEKLSPKPASNFSVKVDLETSRPLKSIYSPSHNVDVKRQESRKASVSYEAGEKRVDGDFALYFAAEPDEVGLNLLAHRDGNGDGYFILLASPGLDVNEKQVMPKDVAFVLDTSGSMSGKKIEQAKKALEFCVNSLNTEDRFEILRFSTEVESLFDKLVKADEKNRSKALEFIGGLRAAGGTAIDDALKQALALRERNSTDNGSDGEDSEKQPIIESRPFVVIFLTDGRPTIGTTDEEQIVSAAKKRSGGKTRVFCFGIGTDVNTHLLDKITEETRAVSQYVLPDEDIEVKVSSFFAKIKDPVLAEPKLKVEGGVHISKFYPSPLPDLFKGDQLVVVGRYSGSGSSAVTTSGMMNGRKKSFTVEPTFPSEQHENRFIPRLWATRRVGYLLDQIRLHGENKELKDEATELARKYGIVTPYTAYLIVEDESQRNVSSSTMSFPTFHEDGLARRQAGADWKMMMKDREGERAIGGSRMYSQLKSANAPAEAAAAGNLEANRALGVSGYAGATGPGGVAATPPPAAQTRVVQYAQQSQYAGGKTFFLNDKRWVDSEVQRHPKAKHVKIEFGSNEYFDLATKYPKRMSGWPWGMWWSL